MTATLEKWCEPVLKGADRHVQNFGRPSVLFALIRVHSRFSNACAGQARIRFVTFAAFGCKNFRMRWVEQPVFFIDFEGSHAAGILEYGVVTVLGGRVVETKTRLCRAAG